MSPGAITSVPLTVPLFGKLTTMPPGQCASVPGLSVQPQTPTVEAPTMSTSSPIIAQDIEAAARRNGFQGILDFYARPDTWSPMYLREEAQFLASVVDVA